uniref:F-box and FNIP repeat-containing protein n=1 Tax=viral metagenome TaxID=1070528 RepID=A0A6C0C8R0_9ZZZZ
MFYFDIFSQICKYLNNKDKIGLSAISHATDCFKYRLIYTNRIFEPRIRGLPFYDNFECVNINCTCAKIPKNTKKMHMACFRECDRNPELLSLNNLTHLVLYKTSTLSSRRCAGQENICYVYQNILIPKSVTHLKIGGHFDQPINIPNSVTHLIFGGHFNQSIEKVLPNFITHLTFGEYFNRSIKNIIPNSVTHLTFGYSFNASIKNCIPDSVTHLTLRYGFDNFGTRLPASITCLKLENYSNIKHKTLFVKDLDNFTEDYHHILKKYIPGSMNEIIIVSKE